MELKDIVCDKKYSDILKKLGLKISSLMFYNVITDEVALNDDCDNYINVRSYAYTVAELGEMLLKPLVNGDELELNHYKCSNKYCIDSCYFNASDEKEANARAKLLCFLIEKNHVKVEDLNNA